MTYESQRACERIVELCEGSENLTGRQIKIYDVALQGLGLVSGQRAEITEPWRRKIIEEKRARQMAKLEREQAEQKQEQEQEQEQAA